MSRQLPPPQKVRKRYRIIFDLIDPNTRGFHYPCGHNTHTSGAGNISFQSFLNTQWLWWWWWPAGRAKTLHYFQATYATVIPLCPSSDNVIEGFPRWSLSALPLYLFFSIFFYLLPRDRKRFLSHNWLFLTVKAKNTTLLPLLLLSLATIYKHGEGSIPIDFLIFP